MKKLLVLIAACVLTNCASKFTTTHVLTECFIRDLKYASCWDDSEYNFLIPHGEAGVGDTILVKVEVKIK